jgi:HAD superfamily hydrolase (TIGR01490 family)
MTGEERPEAAAFFDLDRTIISGSSVFTFGLVAYRNGMLPRGELIRDLLSAIVFKFAGASDEKSEAVKNRILESISGTRVEDLRNLGGDIIPRLLDGVRRESRGLIDLHHDAGRDTYIVSASPIEIISDFAAAIGMTGALGTVAEVVDNVYTGELAEPFCYGDGKAIAIEKLAAEQGYDLELCYAYSDSGSDLPMLEAVGHPVAVNPDRALETVAYHRGWPIVEFSRTRKRVVTRTTAAAGTAGIAAATYLLGRRHGKAAAAPGILRLRAR